jgi:hypothetical protein
MSARDKMAQRSLPFLPPGTQIRHAFYGQTGPSPYFFFLIGFLILFLAGMRYRIVAVADNAIYVLECGFWGYQPKRVLTALPRQTRFGPVSGLWAGVVVGNERIWVHKRFQKDVEAADAELAGVMPAAPAPALAQGQAQPYPQPQPYVQPQPQPQPQVLLSPDGRFWWDGHAWQPVVTPGTTPPPAAS